MHIYFSGIGGKGIAALAHIALDAGYDVSGSDKEASSATKELAERGANITFNQDGEFLADCHANHAIDWLVYTAALPPDHPELLSAKSLSIEASKRHDFIKKLCTKHSLKLLAISGTHGKTTTTAMLIWLFKKFFIPISYAVGADISFGQSGSFNSNSSWFVFEADEFDRNMLQFYPEESVIVNIDYDHKDTYPTRDDYEQAFAQFISQSEHSVLWQDDASKIKVAGKHTVIPSMRNLSSLKLAGEHNRKNAWLAATSFLFATTPDKKDDIEYFEQILECLNDFPGSKRRMEKITGNIYSDFAHTPEEIAATLQAASEIGTSIVVVYQPHQNVRQHVLRNKYEDCFKLANKVFWTPTYLSREDPNLAILPPEDLIPATDSDKFEVAELNEDLIDNLKQLTKDSIVICMGAGDIDDWLRRNF